MMKTKLYLFFLVLFTGQSLCAQINQSWDDNRYLNVVRAFADTLLAVGTDEYGLKQTSMWASVIDLNDLSIPNRNVPATTGVRSHDRAVGGSNYYHDIMTMKVFEALSEISGDPSYTEAVTNYSKDFLMCSQNPKTGLLGWGEHLFYDFYRDTISISESKIFDQRYFFGYPHEFLAWTPPWVRFWKIDSGRTKRAIEGVMWHFQGPDTKVYLFNRHASWNTPKYQTHIMPWIKHSVLFSYSFASLHQFTGNDLWKKRALDIALLYWNNRDHDTNLVFNCFYHPSEPTAGKRSSISGTGLYAYWMYKTGEILESTLLKQTALELMRAYHRHGWNDKGDYFYNSINLDGGTDNGVQKATPWKIGYGSSSLFSYGRAATYLAKKASDTDMLNIAISCEKQVPVTPLPDQYTALNIGEAINFYMDLYELTDRKYYLTEAREYANMAIDQFSKNGLLARQTGDGYYEAKLGIGDLLTGIFRVGMVESGLSSKLNQFDFSY